MLTETEKNLLTDTLVGAAAIAIKLDAGIIDTPKAFVAGTVAIKNGLDSVAHLPLLGELHALLDGEDSWNREAAITEDEFFDLLKRSHSLLRTKGASVDVEQAWKRIVLDAARAAAQASGGSLFGKASADNVNAAEKAFLARIEST